MEKNDEELIQSLLDKDAELRRYYQDHEKFEQQLEQFNGKGHLSSEEEVERKRIQKLKLAGKDRIMEILHRYRSAPGSTH